MKTTIARLHQVVCRLQRFRVITSQDMATAFQNCNAKLRHICHVSWSSELLKLRLYLHLPHIAGAKFDTHVQVDSNAVLN